MRIIPTPWPDRAIVVADLITHEEWFTPDELAIANEFKLAKRRDEWLLSRAAAKRWALQRGLCNDARSCNVARPFLVIDGVESEWHISLSHSSPYAGAAFARDPIGIDVQVLRDFPDGAAHLFLTNDEQTQMRTCALPHRLLHFWCAKEAAWKKLGGAIPTLKQVPIHIESVSENSIAFDIVESVLIDDLIVAISR